MKIHLSPSINIDRSIILSFHRDFSSIFNSVTPFIPLPSHCSHPTFTFISSPRPTASFFHFLSTLLPSDWPSKRATLNATRNVHYRARRSVKIKSPPSNARNRTREIARARIRGPWSNAHRSILTYFQWKPTVAFYRSTISSPYTITDQHSVNEPRNAHRELSPCARTFRLDHRPRMLITFSGIYPVDHIPRTKRNHANRKSN